MPDECEKLTGMLERTCPLTEMECELNINHNQIATLLSDCVIVLK